MGDIARAGKASSPRSIIREIGIRYIITAFVFLALGGIEALVMRMQLAGPNLHAAHAGTI